MIGKYDETEIRKIVLEMCRKHVENLESENILINVVRAYKDRRSELRGRAYIYITGPNGICVKNLLLGLRSDGKRIYKDIPLETKQPQEEIAELKKSGKISWADLIDECEQIPIRFIEIPRDGIDFVIGEVPRQNIENFHHNRLFISTRSLDLTGEMEKIRELMLPFSSSAHLKYPIVTKQRAGIRIEFDPAQRYDALIARSINFFYRTHSGDHLSVHQERISGVHKEIAQDI
jgi:hypothetical protein